MKTGQLVKCIDDSVPAWWSGPKLAMPKVGNVYWIRNVGEWWWEDGSDTGEKGIGLWLEGIERILGEHDVPLHPRRFIEVAE